MLVWPQVTINVEQFIKICWFHFLMRIFQRFGIEYLEMNGIYELGYIMKFFEICATDCFNYGKIAWFLSKLVWKGCSFWKNMNLVETNIGRNINTLIGKQLFWTGDQSSKLMQDRLSKLFFFFRKVNLICRLFVIISKISTPFPTYMSSVDDLHDIFDWNGTLNWILQLRFGVNGNKSLANYWNMVRSVWFLLRKCSVVENRSMYRTAYFHTNSTNDKLFNNLNKNNPHFMRCKR